MLQSLRSFFFWRNSLSEAESFALRANTTVTWDWLRWRGSNPRLGMAVRLAGRKNCGKHVWGLQFHCTGFFIYTTNNHVDLFNDQHIASTAVVGCWSILLRARIIILALSCGASSTDAARASRSSRRQRRVARRGFRHAGMRIDMQGSLELRSLFPFVSRPRAYIIHVISTLWIKQWTPISYLSPYSQSHPLHHWAVRQKP